MTPIAEPMTRDRELYLGILRFVLNIAARRGITPTQAAQMVELAAATIGARLSCER